MTIVNDDLLNVLFNSGFEEDAEINTSSGTEIIKAHFYDKYQAAKYFDKDIDSSAPMIECRTVDVADIKLKSVLTIRGIDFVVNEIQSDGDGLTRIILTYD